MTKARAIATASYGRYDIGGNWSASKLSARYYAAKEDHIDQFHKLLKCWRADTLWCSFSSDAMEHEAFKGIILLGEKHPDEILELIVQEVDAHPDMLLAALPILAKEDPVNDADRGNLSAMASAWVKWFHAK